MLKKAKSLKKMEKGAYHSAVKSLELKLGECQREALKAGIPVIIVFEGWDASGKGTLINKLMMSFDPRGYNVHSTLAPTEEEELRPYLWRFWIRTPEKGRIAIFDRSWYRRLTVDRVEKNVSREKVEGAPSGMNNFEKQLCADGAVIVKFFLHISKKEQKRRFRKLLSNPATSWRVSKGDLSRHRKYKKYFKAYSEMLRRTDTAHAPWTIVETSDLRSATVEIFRRITDAVRKKLSAAAELGRSRPDMYVGWKRKNSPLSRADLSLSLTRDEYSERIDKAQDRIRELEHEIYSRRIPLLVAYEGWDAAGKGGNIRRLVHSLDPRGYEVVPIAAPNDIEKKHHYLWRFWNRVPKAGHIAIFDRSWYGRILVEKVEGFCTAAEAERAYGEINEMERLLRESGAVIVKFWLHIDKNEQLRRFKEREKAPWKQWKITEEDWRNRKKWERYFPAVEEMLARTSTKHAPWTIIEANCKLHARVKAIETVIESLEEVL
ncbi:MAG TPA: polyphosphate:AMP phosphotransferase [Lentisphaeria bacterium]|nr:MAG: polyphosphate:AMP phosphotransferase [Lentisphaerae bacterium GWF2_49_21]HBC86200.1 polyphosphate:AMP phosphotransferase [Lentisphaeria bacterium]